MSLHHTVGYCARIARKYEVELLKYEVDFMRRVTFTLILMSFVTASFAQSPSPVASGEASVQGVNVIDAAQLLADVKTLADDSMEGRKAGTPGGARARAYIVGRFKDVGLKPFGASFEQHVKLSEEKDGARDGANVVGYVAGKTEPNLYLVVTAHYDHLGVKGGKIYNGADDNASGVAALLQLASYFSRHQPAHSVVFAALDAEEGSGAGAKTFVGVPHVEKKNIVLDINLDMVSHSDRGELYAAGAHPYPFLRPYLEQAAAHATVKLLLGHDDPKLGHDDWTFQSDQGAFHREHIPFVYFGVEDHKDYHQPTDDFDTITPDFFARAAATILETAKLLDANLKTIQSAR
ncbi:MAG: M20/M25/M40 family metallo-hydrolase [Pyrinomonadaceae bacterium]